MQHTDLSELQTSPIPGLVETTPPPGHRTLHGFRGPIPPLICFNSDLLRILVFRNCVFIVLFLVVTNIGIQTQDTNIQTTNQQLTKKSNKKRYKYSVALVCSGLLIYILKYFLQF